MNRLIMNKLTHIRPSLFLGMILASAVSGWAANPTSDRPDTPLATHNTIPEAQSMKESLYKSYKKYEADAISWAEMKITRPQAMPADRLGKAYGEIYVASRQAAHLVLMGEPAGADLISKFGNVSKLVADASRSYGSTVPGGRYKKKILDDLRKQAQRNRQRLERAAGVARSGQLETGEKQLEKFGQELYEKIGFLSLSERKRYYDEYIQFMGPVDDALRKKRRGEYRAAGQRKIQQLIGQSKSFVADARRVNSELAASGVAATQAGGTPVGGLEVFDFIADQWLAASTKIVQAHGIRWAFDSSDEYGTSSDDSQNPLIANARQVADLGITAITECVKANAASSTPETAETNFSELRKRVAILQRRVGGSKLTEQTEPVFDQWAARVPGLKAKVEAYQKATSELLRWRREITRSQVRGFLQQYTETSSLMSKKEPLKETNKPAVIAAFSSRERMIAQWQVSGPANWQVFESATGLLGRSISVSDLLRLSPTSSTGVTQYSNHYFANIVVGNASSPVINELMSDLLVDDKHGPLSAEAADAVSSAEMRDFESAGGQIGRVHLERLPTRFASLSSAAACMVPVGTLPGKSEGPAFEQLVWRFDVLPHWAASKYFVVQFTTQ